MSASKGEKEKEKVRERKEGGTLMSCMLPPQIPPFLSKLKNNPELKTTNLNRPLGGGDGDEIVRGARGM